jgi:hypothetical protein
MSKTKTTSLIISRPLNQAEFPHELEEQLSHIEPMQRVRHMRTGDLSVAINLEGVAFVFVVALFA